jgi:hypothetical protein
VSTLKVTTVVFSNEVCSTFTAMSLLTLFSDHVIDATQNETSIDQQQHSSETLICQRNHTILRFLSSTAIASTRWRVRELY